MTEAAIEGSKGTREEAQEEMQYLQAVLSSGPLLPGLTVREWRSRG